jgi:hypothetical protein
LAVGLGILAKYTMVVFLPSVGLFLLTSPEHRGQLRRLGFWAMCVTAGLCCFPILMWNLQNGWVTVRHVVGLAGLAGGDVEPRTGPRIHWLGPLAYVGGQCALLLIFWFVTWLAAMIRHRPWREPDAGVRYLWWTSAPMFLLFLGFSFKTGGGELNWPVTAYISGGVVGAAWLARQLASPLAWYRRAVIGNLGAACVAGLLGTLFMHGSDHLYPVLEQIVGPPRPDRPFPLRGIDPSCRLRGWRTLAAVVDRLRTELATDGQGPVLIAGSWSLPGELGVYCAGHPQAYSVGLSMGDRHSQYDLWPGPLHQPEPFLGRTFLLVGMATPELRAAFREVDPPIFVRHEERGQPIAVWPITVCKGFKGFAPPKQHKTY